MRKTQIAGASADGTRIKTRPVKPAAPIKNGASTSKVIPTEKSDAKQVQAKAGTKRKIESHSDEENVNKNKQGNVYNLDINNRFEPLQIEVEDNASEFYSDIETESMQSEIPNRKKPTRMPPIIMNGHVGNPKHFYEQIISMVKGGIKIKSTRTKTIFICETENDHNIIIKHFKAKKIEFYTYPIPGQGLVKAVLRGLSNGFTAEDVTNSLIDKGFPPQRIIHLKEKGTNKPIPIFVCLFSPTTPIQSIFKIERLCYMTVRWERYKNRAKLIQCYRCMGFNHTSRTCCINERCLKCGGSHENRTCQVKEPKCANCAGSHWANSPECPILQREQDRRSKTRIVKDKSPPPLASFTKENFPTLPKLSAPQINQGSINLASPPAWKKETPKGDAKPEGMLNELMELIKNPGIISLLGKIIKLLKSLTLAKDGAQRLKILMEEGVAILESWP